MIMRSLSHFTRQNLFDEYLTVSIDDYELQERYHHAQCSCALEVHLCFYQSSYQNDDVVPEA